MHTSFQRPLVYRFVCMHPSTAQPRTTPEWYLDTKQFTLAIHLNVRFWSLTDDLEQCQQVLILGFLHNVVPRSCLHTHTHACKRMHAFTDHLTTIMVQHLHSFASSPKHAFHFIILIRYLFACVMSYKHAHYKSPTQHCNLRRLNHTLETHFTHRNSTIASTLKLPLLQKNILTTASRSDLCPAKFLPQQINIWGYRPRYRSAALPQSNSHHEATNFTNSDGALHLLTTASETPVSSESKPSTSPFPSSQKKREKYLLGPCPVDFYMTTRYRRRIGDGYIAIAASLVMTL